MSETRQVVLEAVVAERRTAPLAGDYHLRQDDDDKDKYRIVIAAEDMGVDLSRMDVTTRYANNPIVLFNHDPFTPIGRTLGVPRYEGGRWVAEFVFAEGDAQAQRIRNLYDQRIINSASIGFDILKDEEGREYPLLVEWSVVYAGLDKSALALRQLDATLTMLEEQHMNNTEERTEDAVEATAVLDADMDAAEEQDEESAAEEQTTEAEVAEETADDEDRLTTADVERMVSDAVERERLAQRAADLIDDAIDCSTATTRELLLAATRSEVADAESRSDEYLRGRLDAILERRARRIKTTTEPSVKMGDSIDRPRGILDLIDMADKRS